MHQLVHVLHIIKVSAQNSCQLLLGGRSSHLGKCFHCVLRCTHLPLNATYGILRYFAAELSHQVVALLFAGLACLRVRQVVASRLNGSQTIQFCRQSCAYFTRTEYKVSLFVQSLVTQHVIGQIV